MSAQSNGWMDGFLSSWSMILVSEIGDKTFFIAMLMAMRHPKLIVFVGALSALAAMTVLSALMGVIVPNLLTVKVTQGLAVILFLAAGIKIIKDTLSEAHDDDEDEMAEAAAALGKKEDDIESGSNSSRASDSSIGVSAANQRWRKLLSPILVQSFTLTFVAEWGDRSQIATIALAAAKNPYGVTIGGILGHAICTGGAVFFGNMIAQKVSHRTVNLAGGGLFIFFALMTLGELIIEHHHLADLTPAPGPVRTHH